MSSRFGTWGARGRLGMAVAIMMAGATVSAGSPQAQIDALNARVEALEARLAQVEAMAEARRKGAEEQPTPVAGGWRKAYNWGLLEKGMGPSAVVVVPETRRPGWVAAGSSGTSGAVGWAGSPEPGRRWASRWA